MKKLAVAVLLVASLVPLLASARRLGPALKYGRLEKDLNGEAEGGEPELDCSVLLRKGALEEARERAQVKDIGNFTSYSGFFTTDNETDNHM